MLDEFILVGGCAVGLLITDSTRPAVRHTLDVDLVTEVTSRSSYFQLCDRLRERGFQVYGDPVCRWKKDNIILDVMPPEKSILGFTNRWFGLVIETSIKANLPSGLVVRLASPPLFIATKLESFLDRGKGDFLHHDIEDIINVVDGRPSLIDELQESPNEVKEFIQQELEGFFAQPSFIERLPWHLGPTPQEQARSRLIIDRLRRLAGL